MLTMCWPSACHVLTVCWPRADRVLTMCWPCADRVLTACWPRYWLGDHGDHGNIPMSVTVEFKCDDGCVSSLPPYANTVGERLRSCARMRHLRPEPEGPFAVLRVLFAVLGVLSQWACAHAHTSKEGS